MNQIANNSSSGGKNFAVHDREYLSCVIIVNNRVNRAIVHSQVFIQQEHSQIVAMS